jgi:hypothetical protein
MTRDVLLSLDVEGSEFPILKTIPWNKVYILFNFSFFESMSNSKVPVCINMLFRLTFTFSVSKPILQVR